MFSFNKFSVNIIIGDDIVETLEDYFLCNPECDLSKIFYKLYGDLEIIHDNGMYVPTLDSEHILYDDGKFSFGEMDSSHSKDNTRGNIVSLTKLFLGTYISIPTGFRDFSSVPTEWFLENMPDISGAITDESFDFLYFDNVLVNGQNVYYNSYVDNIKRLDDVGSMSNVRGYKKVLSNAASKFYEDQSVENENNNDSEIKKSAFIYFLFYPVLFLSLAFIGFAIYTLIRYL